MAFDIRNTYLGTHEISNVDSINSFIGSILPNVYTASSVLLLIYAVVGGFMIVAGAGSEDTGKGKQIVTNAIIGFIIIFASYWIIQIIEIITGITILS